MLPLLFNTIATIKVLCESEADKAADVADKFGDYLRQNLNNPIRKGNRWNQSIPRSLICAASELHNDCK